MENYRVSLYKELKIIEAYNSVQDKSLKELNCTLESFLSRTIPFESYRIDLRYINVKDTQHSAINRRRKENQILEVAVCGKKSISDSLHEIANSRRYTKWIPCLKNDSLNHRINLMIDLLGYDNLVNFKTNGFFSSDNPFNLGIYTSLTGLIPLLAAKYVFGPNPITDNAIPLLAPVMALIGISIGTSPKIFPYESGLPWKEAEYLDNKINDLIK